MIVYLQTSSSTFDLVLSCDALIYFGNLKPIFEGVKRVAKPSAHFVFSTESVEGDGFALTKTGRYVHSYNYVRAAAESAGFKLLAYDDQQIRKEQHAMVPGGLYAFGLSPS